MLRTQLPDKDKWANQLLAIMRGMGLTKKEVCAKVNMSRPVFDKALKGNGSLEQLKEIELAIEESETIE